MEDSTLIKRCPQQPKCNAPECPLDPLYLERGRVFPEEERCSARRSTRLKIVAQATEEGVATVAALKYGGLTKKEWQRDQKSEKAKARFEARTPAEQDEIRERLAQGRRKLGGVPSPKR